MRHSIVTGRVSSTEQQRRVWGTVAVTTAADDRRLFLLLACYDGVSHIKQSIESNKIQAAKPKAAGLALGQSVGNFFFKRGEVCDGEKKEWRHMDNMDLCSR